MYDQLNQRMPKLHSCFWNVCSLMYIILLCSRHCFSLLFFYFFLASLYFVLPLREEMSWNVTQWNCCDTTEAQLKRCVVIESCINASLVFWRTHFQINRIIWGRINKFITVKSIYSLIFLWSQVCWLHQCTKRKC